MPDPTTCCARYDRGVTDVTTLWHDRKRVGIPLAVAAVALLGALGCAFVDLPLPSIAAALAGCLAMVLFAKEIVSGERTKRVPMGARVEGDTLVLGGRRIRRAALRNAVVLPKPGGLAHVCLEIGALPRRVVFEMPEAEAHALLHEWGVDVGQRRATFTTLSPLVRKRRFYLATVVGVIACHLSVAVLAAWTQAPTTVALLFLPLIFLIAVVAPSRVEVGADGIVITWLGRRRFLPYSQIERVETFGPAKRRGDVGVRVVAANGEEIPIVTGQRPFDDGTEQRLLARIEEARSRSQGSGLAEARARLARNDRDLKQWLADLRGLGAGARDTHRIAPTHPDELAAALHSAEVDPATRIGAAVAWVASSDGSARARVRVAAEASASSHLAQALLAAADEDDAALAEAFQALER